jgi:phenylalanyl-tRNA synthetase beta chain
MANIKIPRKQFEKEIGKFDEKMQNQIAMFGTTVEGFDDKEIEIEIFPNRPDLLSYHGFKRSFLTFLGKENGLKNYKINKPKSDYIVKVDSSVKKIRPYTVCAIVKGLKLDNEKIKELIEVQEKLHMTIGRKRKKLAIGIYPLEKIKLPITYTALEPDKIKFTPLESNKEMSGLQILQRHPTGREYAHLLSGKEKFPIFMDADKKVLSMPPIINSKLTGKITEETTDVFVECSGSDFKILSKCLNIIVTILAEMKGEIYQMDLRGAIKETTPNLNPEKMKLSLENTNKLLGTNLNEKQLKKFIEKMGHEHDKNFIKIPAWRTDILHEVDLIEDVAIAYGYDNFVPEIPKISTIGQEDPKETIKRKISDILSGIGMIEISNYHLTNKKDQFKKMKIKEENLIEVEESKTDYTILRKDLSHYILKVLAENVDTEYPQKMFEVGKVFSLKNESETNEQKIITESEHLSAAITPGNFTELKQVLDYLSRMINIKLELRESENFPPYFIEGRCGEIILKANLDKTGRRNPEKTIGFIGEIHPKILKSWRIKMPVTLFEVNLDEILKKEN